MLWCWPFRLGQRVRRLDNPGSVGEVVGVAVPSHGNSLALIRWHFLLVTVEPFQDLEAADSG